MISPFDGFDIKKKTISAKYECQITINSNDYDERTFIESSDKFLLPGILNFYFPEFKDICNLVIPYPIQLLKSNNINIEKKDITIFYQPNEIIIKQDYYTDDVDIGLLMKIFQGNIKYTNDPKTLLNMLHNILPDVDLVQYELILSNMFRSADDEDNKCRITGNYKNSQIVGVKKQVFHDSWNSAIAFQHIDKAIQIGLVKGKPAAMNPIEKVINEQYKDL
jgi:hypothetical protein